jgi:hypothetical protein
MDASESDAMMAWSREGLEWLVNSGLMRRRQI